MGNILQFPSKEKEHLCGSALCLACKHIWEAVAPVGTICSLECPECGVFKGIFRGVTQPDGQRFVCNCGCDLYYIVLDGYQCLMCGVFAST